MDDASATGIVGEVLRVLQGFGVISPWAMILAAILVAVAVVVLRRIGLGAMIAKGWHHLRSIPMDPSEVPPGGVGGEVYPGHTPSPPMPMPGPPDKDLEP